MRRSAQVDSGNRSRTSRGRYVPDPNGTGLLGLLYATRLWRPRPRPSIGPGAMAAAKVRPSWGWLGLAGLIGGGPTFLGTVVGTWFDSVFVFVGCLALAAGAILYVLGELLPVGRRLSWEVTLWGLLAGFLLGVATDLILVAAGG